MEAEEESYLSLALAQALYIYKTRVFASSIEEEDTCMSYEEEDTHTICTQQASAKGSNWQRK